jgi:hypothetical protein
MRGNELHGRVITIVAAVTACFLVSAGVRASTDPPAANPTVANPDSPASCYYYPAEPQGVGAVWTGSAQVTVSWNNSYDSYSVFRAPGTCATAVFNTNAPLASFLNGTGYVDNTAAPGATYAYKVSAYEYIGQCHVVYSACVDATLPSPCFSFNGVTSVTTSDCANNLSWGAASPVCGSGVTYDIHRSTQPDFIPAPGRLASA